VVVYDNQTRSLLQTDQQYPSISSQRGVQANPDGSYDIYFGPKAPEGKESNWIQTIPGKSWNVILRFYGPLKPWFDQTWRPSDIELIKFTTITTTSMVLSTSPSGPRGLPSTTKAPATWTTSSGSP